MLGKRIIYEQLEKESKGETSSFLLNIGKKKICYYPRKGLIAEVPDEKSLKKFKEKAKKYPAVKRLKKPKTVNEIGLLLTEDCNMRCKYCYVSGGKNNRKMGLEMAKQAIDYKLAQLPEKAKELTIYFYGGEPTLEFGLMKEIIEYTKKSSNGLKINTRIFTNGTFDKKVAKWFKKQGTKVIITFHIFKDAQNEYRPLASVKDSYDIVKANIDLLNELDVNYMVSIPLTEEETDRIEEMMERAKKLNIKKIGMSVILEKGRCIKTNMKTPERPTLIKAYKKAKKIGEKKGINVKLPRKSLEDIFTLKCIYCGVPAGDLMILPNGDISTCYGVTDPDKESYDKFVCGKVTSKEIKIDKKKLNKIRSLTVHKSKKCKKCFAKWNCGGGCYVENQERTGKYSTPTETFCKREKKEVKEALKKILNNKNEDLPIIVEDVD